MTIRLPMKYKAQLVLSHEEERCYMYVRSQVFRFKWMQTGICTDMDHPESVEVNIIIPSMEEHEELPDNRWQDLAYHDMICFHLLNRLHMKLKMYCESEFFDKAKINTDFEFNFTAVEKL